MKKYINISLLIVILGTFGVQNTLAYTAIQRTPRIAAPTKTMRPPVSRPNTAYKQVFTPSAVSNRTYTPQNTIRIVTDNTIKNAPINNGNLAVSCGFSTNVSYIDAGGAADMGYTPYGTWTANITGGGDQSTGFYDGVRWSIGENAKFKPPTYPSSGPGGQVFMNNSNSPIVAYNTEGIKTASVTVTSHGQTVTANCTPTVVRKLWK